MQTVLRHEVAQVIVTTKQLGCKEMFRHRYPTRACVIGKTILRNANGVRSLWDNVPTPIRVGTKNVSGGANCQYQAVKGLGSGDIPQGDDMANICEPP
jgi:hypothetical protein